MVIRIASKMLIDFGAKVTRVGKAKNIKYIDERLEKYKRSNIGGFKRSSFQKRICSWLTISMF
jgi:hypothetical protein